MSLEPAPNAASPSKVTFQESGSHSDDFSSCVMACVLTSATPALRNSPTAHSTVASLDGNPAMRPHIWPLPTSFFARAARANPTMVSTSALMAAPPNSGAPASAAVGRGGRAPTFTAGAELAGAGSITPNHGPALGVGSGDWRAGGASDGAAKRNRSNAALRLFMGRDSTLRLAIRRLRRPTARSGQGRHQPNAGTSRQT